MSILFNSQFKRRVPVLLASVPLFLLSISVTSGDATSGAKVSHDSSSGSTLLEWDALNGHYYFVEQSADLTQSFATTKLYKDNDADGKLATGLNTNADKLFFRFTHTDDTGSAMLRADDDGDKIINILEADADMDSFESENPTDSDGDGIPDYWEQFHLSTIAHDASYIATPEGLTLAEAYAAATDPNSIDSDGDGWTDAQELAWGWDPNYDQSRDDDKYSYSGDFDGDGINNGTEFLNGTNASDFADAPPQPPSFTVIDLGEVSDHQVEDIANDGWVIIRKNNYDYHRWHWGIVENLTVDNLTSGGDALDIYAAAINSSGVVVGQLQTGDAFTSNAIYWPVDSTTYIVVLPTSPLYVTQAIWNITDTNKICGQSFLTSNGVRMDYIGMSGQLETGFSVELGSLTNSGSPDYDYDGDSYKWVSKINDRGSFIGERNLFSNGTAVFQNLPVSVISGESPRVHEEVYDINESDMVLAKDVSSPEGALILADGTRVDLGVWDGEELSAMTSLSDPTDPLIILSNWSVYIQKQIWATDASVSLAPIVDKSSFYIYDIWDIFPSEDYYSTDGKPLVSPDGTMISTSMYHAPTGEFRQLLLLKVDVVPDYNRDGKIDLADRNKITDTNPFRFWVNDDDDRAGQEVSNDDVPRRGNDADANDGYTGRVDGMRDLVDFFPLFFDLEDFLSNIDDLSTVGIKLSGDGVRYLKYEDGYAGFTPEDAGNYLRDIETARELADDETRGISSDENNPTSLGAEFVTLASEGKGVLLMEAYKPSSAVDTALKLHVFVDGSELFTHEFHLSVDSVEDMFLHEDLCAEAKEYDGTTASTASGVHGVYDGTQSWSTTNWPDSLTNGKTFVFVHGYNVTENGSRGVQAEVFKRMHQLGSNARFVGVTWNGDTGIDYHKAVFQALQTGEAFGQLSFSGDVTAAGHSAGNLVLGQAIQSGAFVPSRYYMINAAVPIQAYQASNETTDMVEEDWTSTSGNVDVSDEFYASNWYKQFDGTGDARNSLTWKGAFSSVSQIEAINFYSPGEEVLAKLPGDNSASVFSVFFSVGLDVLQGRGAWKAQELVKGKNWLESLASIPMTRGQAGWRLNGDYEAPTGGIESPRFHPFLEPNLHLAATGVGSAGSDKADEEIPANVRFDLLARGIPALSYAAAVDAVPGGSIQNFDMQADGRVNGIWPTEEHSGDLSGWLHSDFRNVALPYNFKMYQEMINRGSLYEN